MVARAVVHGHDDAVGRREHVLAERGELLRVAEAGVAELGPGAGGRLVDEVERERLPVPVAAVARHAVGLGR